MQTSGRIQALHASQARHVLERPLPALSTVPRPQRRDVGVACVTYMVRAEAGTRLPARTGVRGGGGREDGGERQGNPNNTRIRHTLGDRRRRRQKRDKRRHAAAVFRRDQHMDAAGMGQRRYNTTTQRRRIEGDDGDHFTTTLFSLTGFLRRPAHQKRGAGQGRAATTATRTIRRGPRRPREH